MKFGDKKPDRKPSDSLAKKAAACDKKAFSELVLNAFNSLTDDENERRIIELKTKQREVREASKKRF